MEVNELFKDVAKLVHEQGGVIGKFIVLSEIKKRIRSEGKHKHIC